MTGTKWAVQGVDSSVGVIHVAEHTEARLEVFQDCDQAPGPLKLCTLTLQGPAPAPGDGLPWNIAWQEDEAPLCGAVHLHVDPPVKVSAYTREKHPGMLVRDRGGKDHEKDRPAADRLRGGYAFAAADLDDPALLGSHSVKRDRSIAGVELAFTPAIKDRQRLYFIHPAPPRQVWMYAEHTFKLSLVVTIGERTWRADGPAIKVPAHEFVTDPPAPPALKKNLEAEYGTPSRAPPLHARDYVGLVTGLSPISLAMRTLMPVVAGFIQSRLPAGARYSVTGAEIVCTFLSEGAVNTIKDAIAGKVSPEDLLLSGYNDLGIDSFVSAYEADQGPIRAFTPEMLRTLIAAGRSIHQITNEKHDTFKTFDRLPLPAALYAVAALYGQAKDAFARDLEDPRVLGKWTTHADELPLHVQFFWATLYYNTGLANGRGTLGRRGLEYHDLEWPHEDNHAKYAAYEKYNANWRTATFRVLASALGVPLAPGLGPPGLALPGLPDLPSVPGL